MIAVIFMLGVGVVFVDLYAGQLGESPWNLWHHLAVLLPLLLLCLGLVGCIGRLSRRSVRAALAWLVCLFVLLLQLGFYAACLASLYGFHDLPTRNVVVGYADQLVTITAALPVSRGLLLAILGLVFVLLAALAGGLAWLMLRSAAASRVSWLRVAALSSVAFALLLSDPWQGLSEAREPLVSSLHDHLLMDNSQAMQADPVEMATDWRLQSSYPSEPSGTRRHVVLIYIDALRADVLQPYGGEGEMPFLTELVRSGELRQFANLFSSCSQTMCGIASILQSRPAHRVAVGKFSLPMVLKRQGYQLRYLLSSDHQHFLGLKEYYGPGIDSYVDGKDLDPRHATDDLLLLRNLDRLPASSSVKSPQFIMLGLMSVHVQGERHAHFQTHLPDRVSWSNGKPMDLVIPYRNNYLNGVRQADHVIEEIWRWLGQAGYLQQSIVVVTADHGESLGENGTLGHARDLSTPQIHIPLWVHGPDAAWVDQPFAFQTDIAPTILDWLRLPIPASWTGQSLLRPRDRRVALPLFFMNHSDKFGLIFEDGPHLYKYLYDGFRNRPSLFDLYADQRDAHDLTGVQRPESLAAMQARLAAEFGSLMKP